MNEEEKTVFQEHIRAKLNIVRSERTPKIDAEVSCTLSIENKDKVIPIVLEKIKELLEKAQS